MKDLEARIADRKARGKALAEEATLDGKPSKEDIEAATTKTATGPVVVDDAAGKGAGKDWKPNA